MRQAQAQAQRKKKMAKSRRSANSDATTGAQPQPQPPQFSQVPEVLQIICSLSMQRKLPPETCMIAIYHLVNMERQYGHDASFYQLVQGKNDSMVHNFIQTCLHSMTQQQEQPTTSEEGEVSAGAAADPSDATPESEKMASAGAAADATPASEEVAEEAGAAADATPASEEVVEEASAPGATSDRDEGQPSAISHM